MNIPSKAVLASALFTAVLASTSASAGRAELPTNIGSPIVTSAQKVYLENTSGGKAQDVISYTNNSAKVNYDAPAPTDLGLFDKDSNR